MKRSLALGSVAFVMIGACGGRTDLGNEPELDGAVTEDGSPNLDSPIQADSPIVIIDAGHVDVEPPPDANVGTPIQCGTATCDSLTEVCCVTFMMQMVNEVCTSPSSCNGVSLTCSSAENCPPGEVCCADFNQMMASSQCQSACKGGFQNPQLCAKDSECPSGQTCRNTPFGYKICRP
jgi:Cys-rich repeat protein